MPFELQAVLAIVLICLALYLVIKFAGLRLAHKRAGKLRSLSGQHRYPPAPPARAVTVTRRTRSTSSTMSRSLTVGPGARVRPIRVSMMSPRRDSVSSVAEIPTIPVTPVEMAAIDRRRTFDPRPRPSWPGFLAFERRERKPRKKTRSNE